MVIKFDFPRMIFLDILKVFDLNASVANGTFQKKTVFVYIFCLMSPLFLINVTVK